MGQPKALQQITYEIKPGSDYACSIVCITKMIWTHTIITFLCIRAYTCNAHNLARTNHEYLAIVVSGLHVEKLLGILMLSVGSGAMIGQKVGELFTNGQELRIVWRSLFRYNSKQRRNSCSSRHCCAEFI